MAFILLSRDGTEVRLLDSAVFDTRHQALNALARGGGIVDSDEVFVVDLDSATPVIIMPQQQSPAPVVVEEVATPEYVEDAETAPEVETAPEFETAPEVEEDASEETPEVETSAGAWEAPEAQPIADRPVEDEPVDLTDAIRRATGALESAGIVAPESVAASPAELAAAVEDLFSADEAVPVAEEERIVHTDVSELEEVEELPVAPVEEIAPSAWPWDVSLDATPEPPPPPIAETTDLPGYVPDPFEEPAKDVEDLVHGDGGDETIALSRPVIMGSYDIPEDAAVVEEPARDEEAVSSAQPAEAGEPAAESAAAPAYEPGGSDIAELTCDECVYLNTCPKKGESDPSSCGSFQWKSV